MAQLSDILLGLGATEETGNCYYRVQLLEIYRAEYIADVISEIYAALLKSREVQNYPNLASHLIEVLEKKLKNDDITFLQISGFELNSRKCELTSYRPDLSSLGSFQDWISMKEAGHNLFDSKQPKGATGWRYYYHQYITDADQDNFVYPAIMRARLGWAAGEEVAPYWYWYDRTVNTNRAFPRQSPVHLTNTIWNITEDFCREINYEETPTAQAEIRTGEFLEDVSSTVDDIFAGRTVKIPEIRVTPVRGVRVKYGGTFQGQPQSEQDVERLLRRGELRVTREYEMPNGNIRMNYQTKEGRFSGLYRLLIKD